MPANRNTGRCWFCMFPLRFASWFIATISGTDEQNVFGLHLHIIALARQHPLRSSGISMGDPPSAEARRILVDDQAAKRLTPPARDRACRTLIPSFSCKGKPPDLPTSRMT